MQSIQEMINRLNEPECEARLETLYGKGQAARQKERYAALIRRYEKEFGPCEKLYLISAPGRTEIGGNHTDHNNGRVLAAAVNLDALCAVAPREDLTVSFHSEGYKPIQMTLDQLEPQPNEKGTTRGLIRGVASGMKNAGYAIGGFNAVVTSTVAGGSGLSSSAALEVMLTGVLDALYNRFDMPYVLRAQISQRAENLFFGKPSGLLDQMASAAGGLVTVDFRDNAHPEVHPLKYDFGQKGYTLVVTATGGSHANLTDHYAAIPAEMKQIAQYFGQKTLRGITADQVCREAGALRKTASDRAVMRALHFIREDERVPREVEALEQDCLPRFLELVIESGRSSFQYLQNVYVDNRDQSLSLALCLAEERLRGEGAWRIHGGGFAGTILSFVPTEKTEGFVSMMENAFGKGCCHELNIRPEGAVCIIL